MKTVKKLLSVLLAVALVIGTIAIAATAQTPLADTVLTYKLTADKTQAKKGDIVTVTLSGTSNYSIAALFGFAITYDSTYVEPLKTTYGTLTGFKNNGIVIPSGSPLEEYYAPVFNINSLDSFFPEGYEIGSWKLVKMNATYVADYGEEIYSMNNTPIISIKFKILDTAADGTAVIKVDPAFVANDDNTDAIFCNYANVSGDSEMVYNSVYLNAATVNLTDATISLPIVSQTFCNYENLQAAVDNCDTLNPASPDFYDITKYATWTSALSAANELLYANPKLEQSAANQQIIDDAQSALEVAFAALAPSYINLDALNTAVNTTYATPEKTEEYYDAAEWSAYQTAKTNATAGLTTYVGAANSVANQSAVAALINNLKTAFEALDIRYVSLDALNTAVNTTYASPEKAEEFYDAGEWTAYQTAKTNATAGLTSYADKADTTANQTAVAALVTALKNAYEALDARYVSLTALNTAVNTTYASPEKAQAFYDADEWTTYQTAKTNATAGLTSYADKADTADNRAEVAALITTLQNAYEALDARYVSYANLESAIDDCDTAPNPQGYYTADSYAAWTTKLANARSINENRPAELPAFSDTAAQAAINAAATELRAAFGALEAGTCHITSVTPKLENYWKGADASFLFTCSVTNIAKIQIVRGNGSTWTYDRNHPSVLAITDNNDGTETWEISLKMYNESETVNAVAKLGKVWDTASYPVEIRCATTEDAAVRSYIITEVDTDDIITEFAYTKMVKVTIVTGPSAKRIRLISASGATSTYSTGWVVNEDGDKVWTIIRRFAEIGENTQTIGVAGDNNKVVATEYALNFTVGDGKHIPEAPSTPTGVLGFSIAKLRMLKGTNQTFTVNTEADAQAVRIKFTNGNGLVTVTEGATAAENGLVWNIDVPFGAQGVYTFIAEAKYDGVWYTYDIPASFVVLY